MLKFDVLGIKAELLEVFTEARKYIERGWTQYELARNAEGKITHYNSFAATCWCIEGALKRADGNEYWDGVEYVFREATGRDCIFEWNDFVCASGEEALQALDKCIQFLQELK